MSASMSYTTFYQKFGFRFVQTILGRPTLAMFDEFKQSEMEAGVSIRQRQLKRLNELYRDVRKNIPFYSKLYSASPANIVSFEQFATLPVLDRGQVAQNYRDMVAGGQQNPDLLLSRTGGSSGEPLTFYSFKGSAPLGLSNMMRARAWWGIDFNDRSALFIEHGLKFEDGWQPRIANVFHHLRERLVNRVFFSAYRMSATDMQRYYEKLRNFQPAYLIGYASFLYLFAKHLLDNRLPAQALGIRCIFYTSEMLYPWQREILESVFGCPVVGEYGLKECGVVAYECPSRNWHTMDESVYVEIIPLPDSPAFGEVVLTQLLNNDSPLIRYRTGDIAVLIDPNEPCPCGRGLHLMGSIQGRSHDWIVTPSGKMLHGQIFTHALIVRGSVDKFRVHQTKDFNITIEVVANSNFSDEEERLIIKSIKKIVDEPLKITIDKVHDIASGNSGKFRWVRSDISIYERPDPLAD